jgi:diacylglycerol kinase
MIRKAWQHKNLKESFLGALKGVKVVFKIERNAKIIFFIGIIIIAIALLLKFTLNKLAILIIVVVNVFICEIFNSVVESILDIIKPEDDYNVKILKDMASAAVLIVCIGATIIGIILFIPH